MANMKDSEIYWYGYIPENWEINKIKYISKFKAGVGHEQDWDFDGKIIIVNSKYVSTDGEIAKYCEKALLPLFKDDICIVLSDLPNGRALSRCFLVDDNNKYSLNQRVGCFYEYEMNSNYFKYLMDRNYGLLKYDDGVNQTNLQYKDVLNCEVIIPPLTEQQLISEFLDDKVGKIDDILADLRKQVDTLHKYKKSVITKAVTKGLDSSVPMKDSAIDWIGEIPEHWNITKVKYSVKICNGREVETDEGDIPVYGTGGAFKTTDKALYKGISVLLGRKGTIDKPLLVDDEFWTVDTAFYTIMKPNILPKMFYYFATCFDYKYYQTGSTVPSMTQTDLGSIIIPAIKLEEQQEIVNYIDDKCAKIDELIKDKEAQIEKMEKYKKSLIYEYVTGKKRVKGAE